MIGAGNMARALIGGLIERGHPADRLVATDPDEDALRRVERDFGIRTQPGNAEAAASVGKLIADRAKAAGVTEVAFDRSGFKYHGRVKALADAAREGGLQF